MTVEIDGWETEGKSQWSVFERGGWSLSLDHKTGEFEFEHYSDQCYHYLSIDGSTLTKIADWYADWNKPQETPTP